MELVKKIRQAEAQAQEIIKQAKAGAAEEAEDGRENRRRLLAEAEQKRKKAIEAAVAAAQSQGIAEVEKLKTQAGEKQQHLRDKAAGKMSPAVAKVVDYLSGLRQGLSVSARPSLDGRPDEKG
jgi:V/A-type H+-transporting ATPase subunit G/H